MYPTNTSITLLILIVAENTFCRAIEGKNADLQNIKQDIHVRLGDVADWKMDFISNLVQQKKIHFLDILRRIYGIVEDIAEKKGTIYKNKNYLYL